jgi:RNA polymerase sporulation-specific sigma factor
MGKGNQNNTVQKAGEKVMTPVSTVSQERDYSDNLQLIALTQEGNDEEQEMATSELIRRNIGLVRSIALRFCDRGVDFEDLMQIGTIGMIKAIRSFDLSRGTCFSTYAVPLIFGELRRHMRDEGPIKVGRYYKRLGVSLMNAKNRILTEEGRDPGISELAKACGVSPQEAAVALDAMSPLVSLSDSAFGEDESVEIGMLIPDEEASGEIARLCDRIALGQAISKLPEQWQSIVALRYYRNLTQQQTAEHLGLSQVKVSREEKKILDFLRGEMLG